MRIALILVVVIFCGLPGVCQKKKSRLGYDNPEGPWRFSDKKPPVFDCKTAFKKIDPFTKDTLVSTAEYDYPNFTGGYLDFGSMIYFKIQNGPKKRQGVLFINQSRKINDDYRKVEAVLSDGSVMVFTKGKFEERILSRYPNSPFYVATIELSEEEIERLRTAPVTKYRIGSVTVSSDEFNSPESVAYFKSAANCIFN